MINITEMISGKATVSKSILREFRKGREPITAVWNVTNRCNLKCIHCYASSGGSSSDELDTDEGIGLIDELKYIGVKILIFSGGEPLLRNDIYELIKYANKKGFKTVLSTNGTLIDDNAIADLKTSGIDYIGVSIDGSKDVNDWFRGVSGAFDKAVNSLKILNEHNIKCGIRFTATRYTIKDLRYVISLLEDLQIPRLCVYHLIPSGRAFNKIDLDLGKYEKRNMIEFLLAKAFEWIKYNVHAEIETVGSPVDGVYIYLLLKKYDESIAEKAFKYLVRRGGDPSGDRLINIDYKGDVHPNQFWWDYTFGNVRERRLSDILFSDDELLAKLRRKSIYLKGRCGRCPFKDICNGFRVRALRIYGDPWEEDPGCYLSDSELNNLISNKT